MFIFEAISGGILYEFIKSNSTRTLDYFATGQKIEDWRKKINEIFDGEFYILSELHSVPKMHIDGEFAIPKNLKTYRANYRRDLSNKKKPNDPHAIIINKEIIDPVSPILKIVTTDFSEILALRNYGSENRPNVISTCAVIVCPETQELILHERSSSSHTYPDHLHTIGGSIIPADGRTVNADRNTSLASINREVFEETQLNIDMDSLPPMILSEEMQTGFVQVVFLGMRVSKKSLERIDSNWEGVVRKFHFSKIKNVLLREDWVPSGKAHIMSWLALGAPNAGRFAKFGTYSSHELYEYISKEML